MVIGDCETGIRFCNLVWFVAVPLAKENTFLGAHAPQVIGRILQWRVVPSSPNLHSSAVRRDHNESTSMVCERVELHDVDGKGEAILAD